MPKVSVCIPSYNHARYIGASIESVLAQSFEDWELVIVDNFSTDDTQAVVKSFRDPRIRSYASDRNVGLVRNWNRCVSLARGEYVGILPADDIYLPRMLERSVAMLDAHPRLGFTYAACNYIDESGSVILQGTKRLDRDTVMRGSEVLKSLVMGNYIDAPSAMMRRDCYASVGYYAESYVYNADWSLYMRAALSHDAGFISDPQAGFRVHPGGLSAKFEKSGRLVLAEDLLLLEEIHARVPATHEWNRLFREARRHAFDRHVGRSRELLLVGDAARFRAEISYALSRDQAFPLRYMEATILWLASLSGADIAKRLGSLERSFLRSLRRPGNGWN